MKTIHPLLLALALLALVLYPFRRPGFSASPALPMALILGWTVLAMIFAPWPRYALPLRPLLFAVAIFGARHIFTICRRAPA